MRLSSKQQKPKFAISKLSVGQIYLHIPSCKTQIRLHVLSIYAICKWSANCIPFSLNDWLYGVFNGMKMQFSTVFQLCHGGQCTYPCFPGGPFTSTLHNILSKPLAAFPNNHCQNNGQRWERNGSCRNDYHQSSDRILAEPGIEPVISCSQVRNTTDGAMGLGIAFSSLRFKITVVRILWNKQTNKQQQQLLLLTLPFLCLILSSWQMTWTFFWTQLWL